MPMWKRQEVQKMLRPLKDLPARRSFTPFILTIGVALRLNHYFDNRALWLDEAQRALNVMQRSLGEICRAYQFTAPDTIGSAFLSKLLISIFGNHEYILRFFPLVAGIASLFLFYRIVKKIVTPQAIPVALTLFAILDPLVYYTAENKHYSVELFFVLCLYNLIHDYEFKTKKSLNPLALAAFGAVCVWFGFAPIFVLSSIVLCAVVFYLLNQQKALALKLLSFQWIWFISFCVVYQLWLNVSRHLGLEKMWNYAFPADPIWTLEGALWLWRSLVHIFRDTMKLSWPVLGLVVCALGCFVCFKRNKKVFFVYFLPILLSLMAAYFKKYPFVGRVLLFCVPSLVLFISEGIAFAFERHRPVFLAAGLVMVLGIFWGPVRDSAYYLWHPRAREEIKSLMVYLKEHQKPGDSLYLSSGTLYAYKYYYQYYHFSYSGRIVGITNDVLDGDHDGAFLYLYHPEYKVDSKLYLGRGLMPGNVNPQKHDLRWLEGGPRVWILFSHIDQDARSHFLNYADQHGQRIEKILAPGAGLYLYNFNERG